MNSTQQQNLQLRNAAKVNIGVGVKHEIVAIDTPASPDKKRLSYRKQDTNIDGLLPRWSLLEEAEFGLTSHVQAFWGVVTKKTWYLININGSTWNWGVVLIV